MTSDVGSVADELYGLPAGEFTAARDRAAAQARQAGDRDLAATIKKLRRPTASAWSINRLVRDHGEEVARLLEVGTALRQAQADLDADELRRLTQDGQHLVGDLARQASQAAGDAGQALSESSSRELEATLHAALADPGASEAVRSGRLTKPLQYAGFGLVDVADAVATPVLPPPSPASLPAPAPAEEAREALQRAESEVAAATDQADEQGRRAEQARVHQEALRRRISQLDQEREQLRAEEVSAGEEVRGAERARAEANRRLARAEAALRRLSADS